MVTLTTITDYLAASGPDAPTPAELQLIEACRAGVACSLGDGNLPLQDAPDRHVRADLLRLLITGGTPTCGLSDQGVELCGGWISGELDLDFATAKGPTSLLRCKFVESPSLQGAELQNLDLSGSETPGLYARGVRVSHRLTMSENFRSLGFVNLTDAQIHGQLDCSNGQFGAADGFALKLQGAEIGQTAFLSEGFKAFGTVDLNAATIRGPLDLARSTLDGAGGKNGVAFNAAQMKVEQRLFWREVTILNGDVDLSDARVGIMLDDTTSWRFDGDLDLDGFRYEGLANSPRNLKDRFEWLMKGSRHGGEFYPQPYMQLARVFRNTGHDREARAILGKMELKLAERKEREDRNETKRLWAGNQSDRGDIGRHWLKRRGFQLWDRIQRKGSGYGQRPEYALFWLLGAWGLATVVHFLAWQGGLLVPASPIILTSADWQAAMQAAPTQPSREWIAQGRTAAHYETFASIAYALDVLLPILDVGQDAAWSPSTHKGFWGWAVVIFNWVLKLFGWLGAALFAATVGGLLQKDRG